MEICIGYNTLVVNASNTKLTETVIEDTLSCKTHLGANYTQSTACYALDSPLKMVYNSYFHLIMRNRWKTSNSIKICKTEKNMIRIIMGHK